MNVFIQNKFAFATLAIVSGLFNILTTWALYTNGYIEAQDIYNLIYFIPFTINLSLIIFITILLKDNYQKRLLGQPREQMVEKQKKMLIPFLWIGTVGSIVSLFFPSEEKMFADIILYKLPTFLILVLAIKSFKKLE